MSQRPSLGKQDDEPRVKVVLSGAPGVGKSALLARLQGQSFEGTAISTCGASLLPFAFPIDGATVTLQIWDTGGQEVFRSMTKSYFREAAGALLVYDVTNLDSFAALGSWLKDLHDFALPNAYFLLVGNKTDLEEQRQVSQQEVANFCKEHRLTSIETSALNGSGVKEAFNRLAIEAYYLVGRGSGLPRLATRVDTHPGKPKQKKECC